MRWGSFALLMVFLLVLPITLAEKPSEIKISSFVNDYANIFSNEQEAVLSNALNSIYDSKTAEFSIVTIKTLDGYDPQGFAQVISNEKLGNTDNNGLLLLIAIEEKKYWFNVGRGLEPIFNDAKVGRIGREALVPYFKQNMYFEGSISAINEVAKGLGVESTAMPPLKRRVNLNPTWIFLGIFFVMSSFRSNAARNQHGRRRRNSSDLFLAAMFASSMMRGGGGGFGGFGGGGFGGGGAGGGW